MSTDIILVSWNGRADTVRAIESCLLQIGSGDGREDARIIVVDNGSTDGTAEVVARRFDSVDLVRLEKNRGFTGGVAAGLKAASGELAILLNNDAVPEPGWLTSLTRSLRESDDDVIAIAGRMIDMSGKLADFVRGVMTFDGHGFQPGFGESLDSVEQPDPGSEILFASGGNMIVRRKEFLAIGGFDDDYFAYLEDVDFGWRAWLSGYRILWNPEATVRHRSSATSKRLGDFERGVLIERNALQTALKNFDDELLQRFSGPIFLTLLHRLHRYTVDRNRKTSGLARPPFDVPGGSETTRRGTPSLHDPLTTMQFRAIEWFFRNEQRIMEKRAEVQKRRKRTDREIFDRFPLHYVPTYHGDERLFSSRLFETLKVGDVRSVTRTLEEMLKR